MPEDRPTAAFVLALIGAIFHLIGGALVVFIAVGMTAVGLFGFLPMVAGGLLIGGVAILFIVLAFLGAFWMNSTDKGSVTRGGIVTLVIAIIALPTLWGFFIGSLLGFIGAILGLVWNPGLPSPAPMAQTPPREPPKEEPPEHPPLLPP